MSSINVRRYSKSVVEDRRRNAPNVKLGDQLRVRLAGAEGKLRVGIKISVPAYRHYIFDEIRTKLRES